MTPRPRIIHSAPVLVLLVGLLAVLSPHGIKAQEQGSPSLSADSLIESRSGGFKFPDGTVQSTAAATAGQVTDILVAARALSVDQGLYDNRIRDFTHSRAFVEVCFGSGALRSDQNDAGTSTAGGNCTPGDVGWVLEANNRRDADWTSAKATCLQFGMRLPEIFEFQLACRHAAVVGLQADVDRPEWMSNTPELAETASNHLTAVVPTGEIGRCDVFGLGFVGSDREDGSISTWSYRCAL